MEAAPSEHVSGSMIDSDVAVSNSTISRSTLLSGTNVGPNSVVESCMIGRDVHIGSNVQLLNMVIDHGSVIPDGTSMSGGQWPRTD